MTPRPLALPAALALALALGAPPPARAAAYLVLQVEDAPGQGFGDPSPIAPAGGNPATTLGEARLRALEFAAGLWAERLDSPVPIELAVRFEPLGGTPTFATLGLGGPADVYRDFAGAPQPSTWYPAALADRLAGVDLDGGTGPDLEVVFNLDVDGPEVLGPGRFYYGLDGHPPAGDASFVQVALHEIAHGLGFTSQLNLATGAKLLGYDDIYMSWVERVGAAPADLPSMSNAERLDALRSGPELRWVGPRLSEAAAALTAGADAQGRVELYAQPQITTSTLDHFATALEPDDVMEPFYAEGAWDLTLARALLADLGWGGPPGCAQPGGVEFGILFLDDALPAGATTYGMVDGWDWVEPAPMSGARLHHSSLRAGLHQHYFDGPVETVSVGIGETLFAYVYLDSVAPPSTVMLQWRVGGSWEHRAYWGANLIAAGTDGTASRYPMGALPPAGEWVRLEVPAALVGVEGQSIGGIAFSLYDGAASWDAAGVARSDGSTFTWVDDALPPGAVPQSYFEGWLWTGADPPVVSGRVAHHSVEYSGLHQHLYQEPSVPAAVGADDTLYADVFLPPDGPPQEVMVQWKADGSWEHRAYWGENLIVAGTNGAASRYPMGDLPPTGQWVRLEVPAASVGVANRVVSGVSFTLYGGRAVWDTAGLFPAEEEFVWIDDAVPAGAVAMPENDGWLWVSADPAPVSGTLAHQSPIKSGLHSHYFDGAPRTLPDVRADGPQNFDLSVFKNFAVSETARVQFRAEFFNLFNTPQFAAPGNNGRSSNFGNADFGVVSSLRNQPRDLQLALKFIF